MFNTIGTVNTGDIDNTVFLAILTGVVFILTVAALLRVGGVLPGQVVVAAHEGAH